MRAGAADRARARSPGPTPGAGGDDAEMIAMAPHDAVVADRRPAPPRLAGAIGRASRPGRPGGARPDVQRHLDGAGRGRARGAQRAGRTAGIADRGRCAAGVGAQPDAGRHAGAVRGRRPSPWCSDVGWTMMDIGKRIERGSWLTALLRATLTTVAQPRRRANHYRIGPGGLRVVGHLPAAHPGQGQRGGRGRLLLFDAENPRSLAFQLERLRANLKALPGIVRLVAAGAAGRRDRDPAAPRSTPPIWRTSTPTAGVRSWATCSTAMHERPARAVRASSPPPTCRCPGGMQPLWGPTSAG